MSAITLAQATTIADAALAHARTTACDPLAVVVLDAGGHMVVVKREDGAGILRVEIATGKAYGALGFGFGSRELFERSKVSPVGMTALAAVAGGKFVPWPSGVLIRTAAKSVIGAIGISGDTSDKDEAAALAGIAAAGLVAQPGKDIV